MRIESIGMNMQSFTIDANTSVADNNESFSEVIDELSDEMSKMDTDVEHTKPMDYFLSEAEISLGLKKADKFPVVFAVEELSYLSSQNHGENRQSLMNKAIKAYNNSMGIFE
ncbi:MAG: hypothetical protein J6A75_04360 [Lachnospiraceae bacterium]|nr:hypothetical protein [Lachnospiraceae bacterium]